jgi:hypothetical protein
MDGIYQGCTGSVFLLQPVKVGAADLKGGDPPGCILDPDAAQCSALAQEKGSDIDIRGLVCGDRSSPPWLSPMWILPERYDRKERLFGISPGVCGAHQLTNFAEWISRWAFLFRLTTKKTM